MDYNWSNRRKHGNTLYGICWWNCPVEANLGKRWTVLSTKKTTTRQRISCDSSISRGYVYLRGVEEETRLWARSEERRHRVNKREWSEWWRWESKVARQGIETYLLAQLALVQLSHSPYPVEGTCLEFVQVSLTSLSLSRVFILYDISFSRFCLPRI